MLFAAPNGCCSHILSASFLLKPANLTVQTPRGLQPVITRPTSADLKPIDQYLTFVHHFILRYPLSPIPLIDKKHTCVHFTFNASINTRGEALFVQTHHVEAVNCVYMCNGCKHGSPQPCHLSCNQQRKVSNGIFSI